MSIVHAHACIIKIMCVCVCSVHVCVFIHDLECALYTFADH